MILNCFKAKYFETDNFSFILDHNKRCKEKVENCSLSPRGPRDTCTISFSILSSYDPCF